MAERWAVATGNWSSTATWNGGTLPAIDDDIYANGFTVTVDSNRTALTVRTTAGTTAVAGGSFTLSNGVTLTLTGSGPNVIAGSTSCVTYSGTSGNSATLIGNPIGSSTTSARAGTFMNGGGTLYVTGNPTGGSQSTSYGVSHGSTGRTVITGNPTGGSGTDANGVNASSGTLDVIGTPQGGSFLSAAGVRYTGTASGSITGNPTAATGRGVNVLSSSTVNIIGSATGGTGSSGIGVDNSGAGTVTISGDAIGGSTSTAYGARITGTGTLTVAGVSISVAAPGVSGATTATLTSIGSARMGTDRIFPYEGKVVFANLATATLGVRNSAGTLVELSAGGVKNVFSPPSVFGAS